MRRFFAAFHYTQNNIKFNIFCPSRMKLVVVILRSGENNIFNRTVVIFLNSFQQHVVGKNVNICLTAFTFFPETFPIFAPENGSFYNDEQGIPLKSGAVPAAVIS